MSHYATKRAVCRSASLELPQRPLNLPMLSPDKSHHLDREVQVPKISLPNAGELTLLTIFEVAIKAPTEQESTRGHNLATIDCHFAVECMVGRMSGNRRDEQSMYRTTGVTELQRHFRAIIDQVTRENVPFVLTRRSHPEATVGVVAVRAELDH